MSERITWTTERRKLGDLVKWDENPRGLTTEECERLKDSLHSFGYSQLVEIEPDNTILDGHQRDDLMLILPEYGADFEIEVRVSSRKLTRQERKKYIAYKHKGANGHFEWDAMANLYEPQELLDWGWSEEELSTFGIEAEPEQPPEDAGAQVDRAEELRAQWGVEPGQLWQLGRHRLICGDCTDRAIIERLMQGERAGIAIFDPPYGMRLDTDYTQIRPKSEKHAQFEAAKGQTTNKNYAPVIGDDEDYDPTPAMQLLGDVKEQFWWGADYYADKLPERTAGSWLVWDKRASEDVDESKLDAMFGSAFELCWSKVRHKRDIIRVKFASLFGTETQDVKRRLHPTQKAIQVIEWILERYSTPADICADFYAGSGTTLIACERLGRVCRAVEISPAYVSVALQRYKDTTGDEPRLLE